MSVRCAAGLGSAVPCVPGTPNTCCEWPLLLPRPKVSPAAPSLGSRAQDLRHTHKKKIVLISFILHHIHSVMISTKHQDILAQT